MCHVSKFIVANRLFPPPGFAEPAEAEPAQWYGLAEDGHSVLGCEARWFTSDHTRVTPQEAQDGGPRWRSQKGPASQSELCRLTFGSESLFSLNYSVQ